MNACMNCLASRIRSLLLICILLGPVCICSGSDLIDFVRIKAAAEAGDAQAQDSLAEAYRARFDHVNATFWYRKASAQGVANSQYQLAETLIHEATSPLVEIDSKMARVAEAVDLLRRAAQQDHKRAQLRLGRLYQEGRLVSQDYVEAYTWFALVGKGGLVDPHSLEGRGYRDRLILKMSQEQIAEGEARVNEVASSLLPTEEGGQPTYLKYLRLQGISGTVRRRLAIINGQTFQEGEGSPVKVGSSWVYVVCQSITINSARVKLEEAGVMVELKMGQEPTPIVTPSPPSSSPARQVTPPKTQPRTPPQRRNYPERQRNVSMPVPEQPDSADVLMTMLRRLVWVAAGFAVLVALLIVGFVAAVPLIREAVASPLKSSAHDYGPDASQPFGTSGEPATAAKSPTAREPAGDM